MASISASRAAIFVCTSRRSASGKIVEYVVLDDLAFQHRRHGDAGGRAQQRDVLQLGLAAQRFQRILAAEAEFLLDGPALQVVVVGGERGGQGVGELIDGERHLLGEGLCAVPAGNFRARNPPVGSNELT